MIPFIHIIICPKALKDISCPCDRGDVITGPKGGKRLGETPRTMAPAGIPGLGDRARSEAPKGQYGPRGLVNGSMTGNRRFLQGICCCSQRGHTMKMSWWKFFGEIIMISWLLLGEMPFCYNMTSVVLNNYLRMSNTRSFSGWWFVRLLKLWWWIYIVEIIPVAMV